MSYTVVIPCYRNFEQLRLLLIDIANTNKKYRPEKIVIVNDGFDEQIQYASQILGSTLLPPLEVINLQNHAGPLIALEEGLRSVKTPYSIILHSDVRLRHPNMQITENSFVTYRNAKVKGSIRRVEEQYKIEFVTDDPLSLLYFKIAKTPDAFGVGCYGLGIEYANGIESGERALSYRGLPYTFMKKHFFDRLWYQSQFTKHVTQTHRLSWKRICSIDTTCVALNMQCYLAFGFNHEFSPYLYFFDDFCGMLRLAGRHLYMTMDTVIYHPEKRVKPEGSLSYITPEDYTQKVQLFVSRWNKNPIWEIGSLYELTSEQLISNRNAVSPIGI